MRPLVFDKPFAAKISLMGCVAVMSALAPTPTWAAPDDPWIWQASYVELLPGERGLVTIKVPATTGQIAYMLEHFDFYTGYRFVDISCPGGWNKVIFDTHITCYAMEGTHDASEMQLLIENVWAVPGSVSIGHQGLVAIRMGENETRRYDWHLHAAHEATID